MNKRIHILIVDDHEIVRKGIAALLATVHDLEVVGEASTGIEAVDLAIKLNPDVILMDLVMPEMDGIDAIKRIKAHNSEARILVMTSFSTDEKVFPAIKAGALGYLLKDSSPNELIVAIRQVFAGQPSLHPKIAKMLLREISLPLTQPPTSSPLTNKEMEILELVGKGLSNQKIADRLVVSEITVRSHVSRILSKLHVASRTQAALYAVKERIVDLTDLE